MGWEDSAWETKPSDNSAVGAGNDAMWDIKAGIRSALVNEHLITLGKALNLQATHIKGSAVCYVSDTAPATTPGGVAISYKDEGRLWVDTTGCVEGPPITYGVLKMYKLIRGTSGETGTYDWRPVFPDMILDSELAAFVAAGTFPPNPTRSILKALVATHIPTSAPDALAGAIWIS